MSPCCPRSLMFPLFIFRAALLAYDLCCEQTLLLFLHLTHPLSPIPDSFNRPRPLFSHTIPNDHPVFTPPPSRIYILYPIYLLLLVSPTRFIFDSLTEALTLGGSLKIEGLCDISSNVEQRLCFRHLSLRRRLLCGCVRLSVVSIERFLFFLTF